MPATGVNQYERAFRARPLLTAAAAKRSTITYVELAEHLRIHPRPIRYVLSPIQDWCLDDKKPPLTILVVNQRWHRPGEGFIAWDVNDLKEGYEQVYSFPWSDLANPFAFAATGATPKSWRTGSWSRPTKRPRYTSRLKIAASHRWCSAWRC
jgi:putative restriction endonuclease